MGRKKLENSKAPTATGKEKHLHQPPSFGLHLGKIINQFVLDSPNLSIAKVAESMDTGKTTLSNKFKVPYYGTVYDLLKLSISTGHDFFAYPQMVLRTKEVDAQKFYSEKEYEELRKENDRLKNVLQRQIEENDTLRQLNKYMSNDLKVKKEEFSY